MEFPTNYLQAREALRQLREALSQVDANLVINRQRLVLIRINSPGQTNLAVSAGITIEGLSNWLLDRALSLHESGARNLEIWWSVGRDAEDSKQLLLLTDGLSGERSSIIDIYDTADPSDATYTPLLATAMRQVA